MEKLVLTIGIPTYNRAGFLPECLDSLRAAVLQSGFGNQIEILISDNASTDNTPEVVARYKNEFPNFSYSRNGQNLEFDGNVLSVLSKAKGQWCWLMSDDEIVDPGSLEFLWPLLGSRPEVSYICINHGSVPQATDIEYYENGSAWLQHLGPAGGLLSQNIFRMRDVPQDKEKYLHNHWTHFSIALEIMGRHGAVLVKKLFLDPAVPRKSRAFVNGVFFYTYNSLFQIIRNLSRFGYQKKIVEMILRRMAHGAPHNIASGKLQGLPFRLVNVQLLFRNYASYPLWLCFSLAVYLVPSSILKFIKRLKLVHS